MITHIIWFICGLVSFIAGSVLVSAVLLAEKGKIEVEKSDALIGTVFAYILIIDGIGLIGYSIGLIK